MDYNISLEEEKGSYSPKSDPSAVENRNIRLEKVP